jgi:hypothetical protein
MPSLRRKEGRKEGSMKEIETIYNYFRKSVIFHATLVWKE